MLLVKNTVLKPSVFSNSFIHLAFAKIIVSTKDKNNDANINLFADFRKAKKFALIGNGMLAPKRVIQQTKGRLYEVKVQGSGG